MSFHCLLASMVSDYKTAIDLSEFFVCDESLLLFFSRLSLFLVFNSLIMMCVDEGHFEVILLGVHGASCMCRWILFIKFGKFSTIIFKYSFCLFFFSFWDSCCIYVGMLTVFHRTPSLCLFFSLFFIFLFPNDNLNCLTFQFANSFFCLFKSAVEPLCWIVQFSYYTFQLHKIYCF